MEETAAHICLRLFQSIGLSNIIVSSLVYTYGAQSLAPGCIYLTLTSTYASFQA